MSEISATIDPNNKPCCISFNSAINSQTASVLMGALAQCCNKQHKEIHVLLNTPGGSVQDGICLYNFIKALPQKVVMYNMGNVDSIGNVIYQAGNYRVCASDSSFMFHGIGFDVTGKARFEQKDVRERLSGLANDQSKVSSIIARHSNMSKEELDTLFLEARFMKGSEAVKHGLADEVAEIRLPPGLPIIQLVFQG